VLFWITGYALHGMMVAVLIRSVETIAARSFPRRDVTG
jgi:hypothetical protein